MPFWSDLADLIEAKGLKRGGRHGGPREGYSIAGAVRVIAPERSPWLVPLLRHWGRSQNWQDGASDAEVVAALRAETRDPDADIRSELEEVFGARPRVTVRLAEECAGLTVRQLRQLAESWASDHAPHATRDAARRLVVVRNGRGRSGGDKLQAAEAAVRAGVAESFAAATWDTEHWREFQDSEHDADGAHGAAAAAAEDYLLAQLAVGLDAGDLAALARPFEMVVPPGA